MPRKVCWPEPDIICADGGCIYCESSRVRKGVVAISDAVGGIPTDYIWRGGDDTPGRIPSFYYGATRVPYRHPRTAKRVKEYEQALERGLIHWRSRWRDPALDDLDC
jgi:hypothetical protein